MTVSYTCVRTPWEMVLYRETSGNGRSERRALIQANDPHYWYGHVVWETLCDALDSPHDVLAHRHFAAFTEYLEPLGQNWSIDRQTILTWVAERERA